MEQTVIPAPMTFEQAMAILEKQHQDTLAKIEADKIKYEKQHQDTLAKIEADRKLHQEQMKKRDEEFEEQMGEFKKEMKNLSRRFGDLGNRLGDIVEYLVASNLKEKFDKYGFYFRSMGLKIEISDGKKTITDIDVLLYDGDKIMAVEVKTKPTIDDVQRHILRMEQIVQYTNFMTEDKKVYGAIACAMLEEEVKEEAFKSGFYLICQTGDNIDIVEPPDGFVAKYWDTKLK